MMELSLIVFLLISNVEEYSVKEIAEISRKVDEYGGIKEQKKADSLLKWLVVVAVTKEIIL